MTVLSILTFPDPRLRRPCLPVGRVSADIRRLAADMLETMYAAPGRGLAGPQVGLSRRIFVMDPGWKEGRPAPRVCIDPVIVDATEATAECAEGCLSIPGVVCRITRPAGITLEWTDPDGSRQVEAMEGAAATIAQHELDHLNGRLCIDLLSEADRIAASPRLAALGAV